MEADTSEVDQRLGQILCLRAVITEAQLSEAKALQLARGPNAPSLGQLLVEKGFATPEQVRGALAEQRPPGFQDSSTNLFLQRDAVPAEVESRMRDRAAKFGKYVLLSEIGSGTVGIVYKAWDTYLGQFVALKRLAASATDSPAERQDRDAHIAALLKEARNAVRLRHPHIVTIYDVGRIGRDVYMSMEYLEGSTLSRHLAAAAAQGKALPFYDSPLKYLRMMRDVSRAVHYAHTRPVPVVHCDLKPSNLFVDRNDRAYVTDFGLARKLRGADEQREVVSGTPSYMAPEQAVGRAEDIDARTDVYGLGSILYVLLAGRPPFVGAAADVLHRTLAEAPAPPLRVAPHLAGRMPNAASALEEICLRCLQKDRSARYRTAQEVAEALERIPQRDSPSSRRFRGPSTPRSMPASPAAPPPPETAAAPAPSRRARRRVLLAAFALAAAGAAALLLVPRGGASHGLDREAVQQMLGNAAGFRSDVAIARCEEALRTADDPADAALLRSIGGEFRWMEQARRRVVEGIDRKCPTLPALTLRDRSLPRVKILRATASSLVCLSAERPVEIDWRDVAPEQVFALAESCAGALAPAERFGMALYARRAGLLERSRSLRESLRGTDLEQVAERTFADP